jgi:hypothetical protein
MVARNHPAAVETASSSPRNPRDRRRWIVTVATALLIAIGVTGMGASSASAWVQPGAFISATCFPTARAASVNVELFVTNNEYVEAAAAVVRTDGWSISTSWTPMTGRWGNSTVRDAAFSFTNLPAGTYNVYYIYKGYSNGVPWMSNWKLVSSTTQGHSNMSGVTFGGSNGCRL